MDEATKPSAPPGAGRAFFVVRQSVGIDRSRSGYVTDSSGGRAAVSGSGEFRDEGRSRRKSSKPGESADFDEEQGLATFLVHLLRDSHRADARRLVAGDIGVAVELAAEVLVRLAAGRIFRVGILVQGKGARLGQILESVLRG